MFLLKRLLTGKLGFDKSVFLFWLLINRAYFMCKLWAFLFSTGKLNNLAQFQFFKCLILSKGWDPQAQEHLMGHGGEEISR